MGVGFLLLALYGLIGYKLHWKHIYCSYQKAYRKEMTPDKINWGWVKKTDAYGVPIIFCILGEACIVCHLLFFHT